MGEWKVIFGEIVCSSLMRGVKTCFCDNNFLVYGGCNFLDQIQLSLVNWSPDLPGEYYCGPEILP